MFCSKCGEKLGDNEKFCHKCGEPVYKKDHGTTRERDGNFSEKRSKKLSVKRPYLLAAAVVCVICIFFCIRFAGNGNYERPIKLVAEGVEQQDIHKIMSAIFPEEVEEQWGIDMDGVVDMMEEYVLDKFVEEFGDGADLSMDYQIKEKNSCSKEEIAEMEEDYNDAFRTDVEVKDAKKLVVKTKVSANGEKEESTEEITVIKIGRKWYMNFVDLI